MNTVYVEFTPARHIVKVTTGKERLVGFARDKDASKVELWLPREQIHSFDYDGHTPGPWMRYRVALRGIMIAEELARKKNLRWEEVLPF